MDALITLLVLALVFYLALYLVRQIPDAGTQRIATVVVVVVGLLVLLSWALPALGIANPLFHRGVVVR